MAAELPIRKAAAKVLQTLQQIDLPQLWTHLGLNFEKLHGMFDPLSGDQLYSLRITGQARAITCLLKGPTLLLICLHTQHDKAYRK